MTPVIFFLDKDRSFKLGSKEIAELERLTDTGIGALCSRVFGNAFRHVDLIETIRLGLIGGGCHPFEASHLVTLYVEDRPLDRYLPIATGILSGLWFGPKPVKTDAAPVEGEQANA